MGWFTKKPKGPLVPTPAEIEATWRPEPEEPSEIVVALRKGLPKAKWTKDSRDANEKLWRVYIRVPETYAHYLVKDDVLIPLTKLLAPYGWHIGDRPDTPEKFERQGYNFCFWAWPLEGPPKLRSNHA